MGEQEPRRDQQAPISAAASDCLQGGRQVLLDDYTTQRMKKG